ncbi:hypothetical protein [Paraburkholderia phenoliruptrix]|uniref:hypothetical protein n=1 Tax=Paraburkholderia phenoliruptrix TaxID=252970 RepID=UPI002869888B|nr:hypothetical protein [Paraburkholderia phenoliruptrix]WMY08103.1 hypothetical protein P3F88_17820 [Paraburkholderia phenoliruptrix]
MRELIIDLDRLENVIFNGDGPAYKAMNAVVPVREREGYDGFRGHRALCARCWNCWHIHDEVNQSGANDGLYRRE